MLCVVRVKSQEEAMALIDAHEYGNGTCLFTRDGKAARRRGVKVTRGLFALRGTLRDPGRSRKAGETHGSVTNRAPRG